MSSPPHKRPKLDHMKSSPSPPVIVHSSPADTPIELSTSDALTANLSVPSASSNDYPMGKLTEFFNENSPYLPNSAQSQSVKSANLNSGCSADASRYVSLPPDGAQNVDHLEALAAQFSLSSNLLPNTGLSQRFAQPPAGVILPTSHVSTESGFGGGGPSKAVQALDILCSSSMGNTCPAPDESELSYKLSTSDAPTSNLSVDSTIKIDDNAPSEGLCNMASKETGASTTSVGMDAEVVSQSARGPSLTSPVEGSSEHLYTGEDSTDSISD